MRIRRIPHRWIIMAAVLIALIIVTAVAALFFADEPLRRYTEANDERAPQGLHSQHPRPAFQPEGRPG
jgi:hypothetical protein